MGVGALLRLTDKADVGADVWNVADAFWLFQVIFEKEGVYLHTNAKKMVQDMSLPGFIRVVERVSRPVSSSSSSSSS